jgi:hypothetical protein
MQITKTFTIQSFRVTSGIHMDSEFRSSIKAITEFRSGIHIHHSCIQLENRGEEQGRGAASMRGKQWRGAVSRGRD